jgi:glycosyltransferase involved in cell wall biosynthesis
VKRVVFFVHMVPRFVTDFGAVARYLVANRIATTIYAPPTRSQSPVGWAQPEIAARYMAGLPEGARLHPLPIDRERLGVKAVIRAALTALSLARRSPDTLFVLWTVIPILVCGLPLRVFGRPCVFLLTGLGSLFGTDTRYRRLGPIIRRVYAYLFSGPNSRVIVHNHEDKAFVCGLGVDPSHIVVTPGCGVDPEEFPFAADLPHNSTKVVLVPVRLLREKGVLDAAAASDRLLAGGIDHEMWFSSSVDPGNPSSLTQEEIEQVQQNSLAVRFVGYQASLIPLYRSSDVVCVPTRYQEGLPTALLEAAACGRPIVATDNVGCREFVEDGRTGLMASCGSSTELATALARVLTDQPLAERLRRNAYDHYRAGFTKSIMVVTTIDVMRDLGLQVASCRAELA